MAVHVDTDDVEIEVVGDCDSFYAMFVENVGKVVVDFSDIVGVGVDADVDADVGAFMGIDVVLGVDYLMLMLLLMLLAFIVFVMSLVVVIC